MSSLVDTLSCTDGGALSQPGSQLQLAVLLPANVPLGGTLVVNITARARSQPDLSVYLGAGCFSPRGAAAFGPLSAAVGTFVCATGNNLVGSVGSTVGLFTTYTRTAAMPAVASRVVTLLLQGSHLAEVAGGAAMPVGFSSVYVPPTVTPTPSGSRGTSPSAMPSPSQTPLACPVDAALEVRSDDGSPTVAPVVQLNASAPQLDSAGLCSDGALLISGPAALVAVTIYAPLGGTLRLSTCVEGTDFDTVMFVGTGCPAAAPPGASLVCLASNDDDANCGGASTLLLPGLAQATVYVMIKPYEATSAGRFALQAAYVARGAEEATPSAGAAASATPAPLVARSPISQPLPVSLVGAYVVGDTAALDALGPTPLSCREACAAVFGGSAGRYQCSVDPPSTFELQLGTAWVWGAGGNSSLCGPRGPGSAPGRDDFKAGVQVGDPGSWSAYARGGCPGSINYCWSTTGNSGPPLSRSPAPPSSTPTRTRGGLFPSRAPTPSPSPVNCPLGPVTAALGSSRLRIPGTGYGMNPRSRKCKVRFVDWTDTSSRLLYCLTVLGAGIGSASAPHSWVDAYGHPVCDAEFTSGMLTVDKRGRNEGQDSDPDPVVPCSLLPGTSVVRGDAWRYGDEDGGAGSMGVVTDALCPDEVLVGVYSCSVIWPLTSPCGWAVPADACNCSLAALLGAQGHFHYSDDDLTPLASSTPSLTATPPYTATSSPSETPTASGTPTGTATATRSRMLTASLTRTRSPTGSKRSGSPTQSRSAGPTLSRSKSRKPKRQ